MFVLLICFGGSAWADKQKIAVLGLEVAPGPGGTVDPTTTQVAKEITRELRLRAQAGTSPYALAPNSNKELTDEKLLMSCDNEAKECMAVIGAGLATDVLLYGRVERKGELYRVTLKLLDVKAKTIVPASDEMPVGASPAGVSKRLYGKLMGEAGGGSLVVTAHGGSGAVDGGKVFVDEERVGELSNGKLSTTVAEGRHTVAIEASGYRRFEEQVSVKNGQQTKLEASLVDRNATAPAASASSGSSTLPWKITFGAGIGIAALSGAYAAYAHGKVNDPAVITKATGRQLGSGDCDADANTISENVENPEAFHNSCKWNSRSNKAFIGVGVGGAVAIFGAIMWYRGSRSEERAVASRRKITDVALTPVITSDQTGAALSFRW